MERLQKIIAEAGIASRRSAEKLIEQGRVKVDGKVIIELGYKASKSSVIEVDGKKINKEEKVYYVINKPKKVISSVVDDRGRIAVVELLDVKERIFPIGRLDYDTTGVLLLSNDGEFSNMLIHPRYHVEKEYDVTIKGVLKSNQIKDLESGILIDNKKTLPCKVHIVNIDLVKGVTDLQIIIKEGRNHQVKKMMEYFGYKVTKLNRRRFGCVDLKGLNIGEYRRLKPFEIKKLKSLANTNENIK